MRKLSNYISSSIEELRKVAWPTRKQAIDSTLIVLGITIVAAAFITVLDLGLQYGYRYISSVLSGI